MNRSLQNKSLLKKTKWSLGILFLLLIWLPVNSLAQTKVVANTVTATSGNKPTLLGCGGFLQPDCVPTVQNPNNATSDNSSYARVLASPGVLAGGLSYQGFIELEFENTIPANQWSYVRINADTSLLSALLGGSLGDVLSGVLGAVLLGNQEIEIEALNNTTSVLKRNSTQGFDTSRVRLITNAAGEFHLAINPDQSYNRVRVANRSISLLGLGTTYNVDVYHAETYPAGGSPCGRPMFTSFDGGGGLGLEVLGNLVDQNLGNAIDTDLNSFSTLKTTSVVALDVANTFSQQFYFPSVSNEHTTANIKLALGSGGLINTDLLGGIEVAFWNGSTQVYHRSLQSGLLNNTDALTLLASGDAATLTFAPGREFDRIEVRLNSTVGLNVLGDGVRIYDVQRYDGTSCTNPLVAAKPTQTPNPFQTPSCAADLIDFDNVDFAQYAVDGNNESYATLHADSGGLLVGPPTAGFIEMNLGNVPANKTTYVRINYDEDVLDRLLGGSLGKLVGDLANDLLLGNQYFEVEAKNAGTSIFNVSSANAFEGNANGVVTLVEDNIGRYYLAITPDAAYDSIRITNHVEALLATGKKASLDVYNACFELGTDSCFPANFTSYTGSGLNLSAGDLNNAGVTNPYRAISANSSEYSEISLGIAGLAASVYQTIYFSQPSLANDKVQIRMMLEPSSALNLDLIGAYKVKFYNGSTLVEDNTLQGGLLNNIDLLSLFNSGGIVELEYEPTGTFDRVEIGVESVVGLGLSAPMRLYSVKRYGDTCPLTIADSPFITPYCASNLLASENADDVQNLFDEDFDSYATLKSGAGTLLGLGNKYEGFVEMGYDQPVAAGTTSYIRIAFDAGILENLLGGSLGNIVSGLLDNVLLGDHFFSVQVKNATGTVIEEASSNAASSGGTDAIRIVQDKDGRFYVAVTPSQDYLSVRITDHTNAALGLLTSPNTMQVYGMCHETDTSECVSAFVTSSEISGINLSVNDLSGMGVTNPQYAINGNSTQASTISNGTLAIGSEAKQWIFFNKVSDADEVVNIAFKTQAGAVDVNLLGNLEIKAYKGNTEVATLDWNNGIVNGINVLNLISNGERIEVPFMPGEAFDRISVGIKTIVGVSVFPPVELYSVTLCADSYLAWKSYKVNEDASIASVKGGEEVEYTIHIDNKGTTDMTGVVVEDVLPENTTYVAGSGGTYDAGTNTVSFENITVVGGSVETVSFKVLVAENLTGVDLISNVAIIKKDATDLGQQTYPPLDNSNPIEPNTTANPGTNIPVDKIHEVVSWKAYLIAEDITRTEVSGGEELKYIIYVKNIGNQDLTNLVVSDELPAGVTYLSGGTLTGTNVSFNISSLAVGETSSSLRFKVKVDEDLTGLEEILNIAVVSSTEITDTESFPPVDNQSPTEPEDSGANGTVIPVTPIHSVAFAKHGVSAGANTGQATADNEITYTLSVKNTGNKTLTNLQVSDEIPANTTLIDEGGFTLNVTTLEATIASLNVNEEVLLSFIVKVDASIDINTITEITNTADLTFRNEDDSADITQQATYNMATDCNPVEAADIELAILDTPTDGFCAGEAITLQASTTLAGLNTPIFKWYKNVDLTDVPMEGAEITVSLTETTTFYVTVEQAGYCFNTPAQSIEVEVNELPNTPSITTVADFTFCAGSSLVLETEVATATSYKWFLDDVEIVGETAAVLTATEAGNYKVIAINASGCESRTSVPIEVISLDLPVTPIITSTRGPEFCAGLNSVLEASTQASSYIWYLGGVEIAGETAKTIDVTAAGSYTVVAINTAGCESEISDAKVIDLLPQPDAPVIEQTDAEVCMGGEVELNVVGMDETALYRWYKDGIAFTEAVINSHRIRVTEPGVYTVTITNEAGCESEASAAVTVDLLPGPDLTLDGSTYIYEVTGGDISWPTASSSTQGASITWYDQNGNDVTGNLPTSFADVGVYTYAVVATDGDCYSFETVTVNVYDADACPPGTVRTYANSQSWGSIITGGVSNRPNAVDGNPKTYSTITTGLGLLGIGTTWQTLFFPEKVAAGTPVTIKLGKEYSGLVLAGGISVVGVYKNGSGTPFDIGTLKPVQGGLLDLLAADNVVEFTFVPSDGSGSKAYDGVRISIGALLSVAQSAKVYGAYITKSGSPSCDPIDSTTNPNIIDVLHGVEDIGLGALSATASVVNPWNAVDNDLNSYALITRGVAVANRATLTAVFKQPTTKGDQLQIILETPANPILSLELIKGYTIQRFMGNQPVGPELDSGSSVLDLKLLGLLGGFNDRAKILIAPFDEPYDRVKISYGSVVGVLGNATKIYDISIVPTLDYGQIEDEVFEICVGEDLVLEMQDECSFYKIYDAEDNLLDTQDNFSFTIPEETPSGENTFYVETLRNGCPIGEKQEIKVMVNPKPIVTEIYIDGTLALFETEIPASPGQLIEVTPTLDWGVSNRADIIWEMENPEVAGEWIAIPFAQVATDGSITFRIPDFGQISVPDVNGDLKVIDIRNTEIAIRLFLESDKGCPALLEGMKLKIDGSSKFLNNPNITNRLN